MRLHARGPDAVPKNPPRNFCPSQVSLHTIAQYIATGQEQRSLVLSVHVSGQTENHSFYDGTSWTARTMVTTQGQLARSGTVKLHTSPSTAFPRLPTEAPEKHFTFPFINPSICHFSQPSTEMRLPKSSRRSNTQKEGKPLTLPSGCPKPRPPMRSTANFVICAFQAAESSFLSPASFLALKTPAPPGRR